VAALLVVALAVWAWRQQSGLERSVFLLLLGQLHWQAVLAATVLFMANIIPRAFRLRVFLQPSSEPAIRELCFWTCMYWGVIYWGAWVFLLGSPVPVSFSRAVLLFSVVALGSSIQLPAVHGGFQAALLFGLTFLCGASGGLAAALTVILWIIGTLPQVLLASLLLSRQRFRWQDLRRLARRFQFGRLALEAQEDNPLP